MVASLCIALYLCVCALCAPFASLCMVPVAWYVTARLTVCSLEPQCIKQCSNCLVIMSCNCAFYFSSRVLSSS